MSFEDLDENLVGKIVQCLEPEEVLDTLRELQTVSRRYRDIVRNYILPDLKILSFKHKRLESKWPEHVQHTALLKLIERCEKVVEINFHGSQGFVQAKIGDEFLLCNLSRKERIRQFCLDYCLDIPVKSIRSLFQALHITKLSLCSSTIAMHTGLEAAQAYVKICLLPHPDHFWSTSQNRSLSHVDLSWFPGVSDETVILLCSLKLKYLSLKGCVHVTSQGIRVLSGGQTDDRRRAGNFIEHLNIAFTRIGDDEIIRLVRECPRLSRITLASRTNNTWYTGPWTSQGLAQASEIKPTLKFEFV